ncbi:MAG: hypothetical protein HFH37_00915 [Lachnospiraceae bacterium]|jgi:hypothetical protein|nr:hypothetical protein [Lachnospiraceae bacterium]
MKKLLRILAILGSILLIGLYFITLILAILGKDFFPMFMAALFASMALPILLWIYSFIYKLTKKDSQQN